MRDAPPFLDSMTFHGPYVFPDFGVQRGNMEAKSQFDYPLHSTSMTPPSLKLFCSIFSVIVRERERQPPLHSLTRISVPFSVAASLFVARNDVGNGGDSRIAFAGGIDGACRRGLPN